jgi:uncharacterized membrane protein HdeD (DUF308 family)
MIATLAAQGWRLFIVRGVLALLFGGLALVAPGATLTALVFVFAFYAIVDGVLAVGLGFGLPGGPRWLLVLGGVAAVAIGVYTGFNPSVTAGALVLLIGAFSLVRGITEVAAAISLGSVVRSGWALALSGIVSAVFGAYLIVVPQDGALALVYAIGFYALFTGVMYVAAGIKLHDVLKTIRRAAEGPQADSAPETPGTSAA